jgi:hypothetical protein
MTERERGDDLADRMLALEQHQRADRRALGSLDADVFDVQSQRRQDVRLLQSLRETQIQHGDHLERLESRLGQLETTTSAGFAAVGARLDLIVALLQGDPG